MTEVSIDRNLYLDPNAETKGENGETVYGEYRLGYRDPETHRIRFDEGGEADAPPETGLDEHAGEQVTVTKSEDVHPSAVETPSDNRVQSTDAASRRAEELQVDITAVEPTGARGEVTAPDVESAAQE